MHQQTQQLKQYLRLLGITAREFAQISGMPLTEVVGILEGRLPITIMRANHLAAVFNTNPDLWVAG